MFLLPVASLLLLLDEALVVSSNAGVEHLRRSVSTCTPQMASHQGKLSKIIRGVQTNAEIGIDTHAQDGKLLHTTLASLEASRKKCVCVWVQRVAFDAQ